MAEILNPTKALYIDNCQCLVKEAGSQDEHAEWFDDHPDKFLFELNEETRLEADSQSANNPIDIYITGNMK